MVEHPLQRTVVMVDVQGFSSKPNPAQQTIRKALPRYLAVAFHRAGIDPNRCTYEDRGDGALIVLPPGADTVPVLKPMAEYLADVIQGHNRRVAEPSRFTLRMAINVGSVHDDNPGHTGATINETARILESTPLRTALSRTSATLAMAVSESVHKNFVLHGYNGIDPTAYLRCRVSVRNTRTVAWIHVPTIRPAEVRRQLRKPMRAKVAGIAGVGIAGIAGVVGLVLTIGGSAPADRLFVDVPRGGGWGAADAGLRVLTVCDTQPNGRGVRMEYVLQGSTEPRSFGDRNGSEWPCGVVRSERPVVSMRVCESDEGSQGESPQQRHDLCSEWVQP